MSGIDLPDGREIRKGAPDALIHFVESQGGSIPSDLHATVQAIGSQAPLRWWFRGRERRGRCSPLRHTEDRNQ
jgi:hypothetical protein